VTDVYQERYNHQINTAQEVQGFTPKCHLHQLKGIEKNKGLEILHCDVEEIKIPHSHTTGFCTTFAESEEYLWIEILSTAKCNEITHTELACIHHSFTVSKARSTTKNIHSE
jgi:hypothetical protein